MVDLKIARLSQKSLPVLALAAWMLFLSPWENQKTAQKILIPKYSRVQMKANAREARQVVPLLRAIGKKEPIADSIAKSIAGSKNFSKYSYPDIDAAKCGFKKETIEEAYDSLLAAGFEPSFLKSLFESENLRKIVRATSLNKRMAESKGNVTYSQYKQDRNFKSLAASGKEFKREHKALLDTIQKELGVPADLIVSIYGIEGKYGQRSGRYPVFNVFLTLLEDYPPDAYKHRLAHEELIAFLKLSQLLNSDPYSVKGSYAGCIGYCQFLPSKFLKYLPNGADGSIIKSIDGNTWLIARYLKDLGATTDDPPRKILLDANDNPIVEGQLGPNFRAAKKYMGSKYNLYAFSVCELAYMIAN